MTKYFDFLMTVVLLGLVAGVLLLMPPAEAAYSYGDPPTDVGDLDVLVEVDQLANSGGATETAWVQSILGPDVTFELKTEDITGWLSNENADVLIFSLFPPDDYFIVKNAQYWALYENVADLLYGVIDTNLLPADMNLAPQVEISHVSVFDAPNGSGDDPGDGPGDDITLIPAPAPLALIGLGLLGVWRARR